jgi:hypothetical protein
MSFTVTFTGQKEDEGIWVDSLTEAEERVRELGRKHFPASIFEIPDGTDYGNGLLVNTYPAPPDD